MKLYDFAGAPNPRRTRIFIAEKGIEIETLQVNLREKEQFTDAYRAINPRCTVPALITDDGVTLTENTAIARYLEDLYPDPPLLGKTPVEHGLVAEWHARAEQEGVYAVAESFRNKATGFTDRALTGPQEFAQIPELVGRGRRRSEILMDALNERLNGRDFIATGDFTLADITALVFVDFAAWIKLPIPDELSNLKRWHDAVSARPSAKA